MYKCINEQISTSSAKVHGFPIVGCQEKSEVKIHPLNRNSFETASNLQKSLGLVMEYMEEVFWEKDRINKETDH